ncbi:MAG: hypothetical protein OEZ14_05685 [Acidimicrobiia bacterium]|nr:hypothetical protein [Acidimicrobiia bacterium]MDH5520008.1 hypothetical protein [Acidimicrobiia bacterium]
MKALRRCPFLPVVVVVGVLVVAGCSDPAPELTIDERIEQEQVELVEAGASPEVADCVVRLARQDLRSGPIDELTRDELLVSCERTQALFDGVDVVEDPDALASVDGPDTLGDDPALDSLWRSCEGGSGAACDDLFEQAPVGSDYERFGVSCGDRDEILRCSELDEESS